MQEKYKLNNNCQLTISRGRQSLQPKGLLSLNNNNQLSYHITEPAQWRRKYSLAEQVNLEGKWSIGREHNLIFTLRKTERQAGGEKLTFQSELLEAKANALLFTLVGFGEAGTYTAHLLELKGKWQADKYNRLQFLVKRRNQRSEPLTFQGIWEVKNNTLSYTYQRRSLKTKEKQIHSLRFDGYWQISRKNRLTYILDTQNNSAFDFRVYLETPNLIAKRGVIKYRVGIGLKGSEFFRTQIVSLYGVWKLQRKSGLSLAVDYAAARMSAINFGVFVQIKEKTKITLGLLNKQGEPLGLNLTFSRSFLKNNAEWFFRVAQEGERPRFDWAVTIPW